MSLPFPTLRLPTARTPAPLGSTAAPVACGACLVAGALYVALDDPADGTTGLTICPYRAMTGLWCPGCGLTRAARHLARGDVLQALSFNALTPLFVTAIALAWWTWLSVAGGRGVPRSIRRLSTRTAVATAALVLAFTVIRNLPGVEVLRGG